MTHNPPNTQSRSRLRSRIGICLIALSVVACIEQFPAYVVWITNESPVARLVVLGYDVEGNSDYPAYLVPPDGVRRSSEFLVTIGDHLDISENRAIVRVYDLQCALVATIAVMNADYEIRIRQDGSVVANQLDFRIVSSPPYLEETAAGCPGARSEFHGQSP